MKIKNLFITLGLAVAATAAIGAGLKASSVQQAKADETTRYYFDCHNYSDYDSNSANTLMFRAWGDATVEYIATQVVDNYWYIDVNMSGKTGYQWCQCKKDDHGTKFNYMPNATGVDYNYCKASGWSSGGYLKINTTSWQVVGATSGNWTSQTQDVNINLSSVKYDKDGLQMYSVSVTLSAGTVFKFSDGTNYYGYQKLSSYNGESAKEKGDIVSDGSGDANIKVVNAGTYEVYVKPADESVWMQLDSTSEAISYAQTFLSKITCNNNGASAPTFADGYSWSNLGTQFNGLTDGAKAVLRAGNANSTIVDFYTRYNLLVSKYHYTNFMNPSQTSSPLSSIVSVNNNSTLIIVVISALVLVSTGGFFFLRKKQENE